LSIAFLMSFFGILVPGVPTNCIGDIADAPPATTGGIDDVGACQHQCARGSKGATKGGDGGQAAAAGR
jgi:hypothetical protein